MTKLLPYFAGSTPAVVLGYIFYDIVLSYIGERFWYLAAGVALMGVCGVMGGEIYAYWMAGRAIANRTYWAFAITVLCAISLSGLVIYAISTVRNVSGLIASIIAAVIIYIVSGVGGFLNTRAVVQDNRLALLKVETAKARAEARRAEAEARAGQLSSVSSKKMDASTGRLNSALLKQVYDLIAADPKISARSIAKVLSIAPTTASKYSQVARGENVIK